mgnify:CR=1 FL=1
MATHFARGILSAREPLSTRLSAACHQSARRLPEYRQTRYCASRSLLAELLFMLYGISELPEIIREADGRPVFRDSHLPRFSISYAGNIVGVTLTTEGDCGLDMEPWDNHRCHSASGSSWNPSKRSILIHSLSIILSQTLVDLKPLSSKEPQKQKYR